MLRVTSYVLHIVQHLWSLRREFAKYFIIGVSAVALDMASIFVLRNYLHLRPVGAVIINQPFLLLYVFALNKYWAFKAQGITRQQMIRFLIVAGMNYIIAPVWMWLFTEVLIISLLGVKYDYLLVRLANVALAVAWNFFVDNSWVYKVKN